MDDYGQTSAANSMAEVQRLAQRSPLVSSDETILVIGAAGQVGNGYLVPALRGVGYGDNLVLADVRADEEKGILPVDVSRGTPKHGVFSVQDLISRHNTKVVINLAALLSGSAEAFPAMSRAVNILAVQDVIEISKELSVRRVFTPSSIAVLGPDSVEEAVYGDMIIKQAGLRPSSRPMGQYGRAKLILETFADSVNTSVKPGEGFIVQCLRYGGVLSCTVPPSDGTTEELDRMIVAAAEFTAKRGRNTHFSHEGNFYPQISADILFPMLDGRTVGRETVRYLHADPEVIRANAPFYQLSEFQGSLRQVEEILRPLVGGDFKVTYGDNVATNPAKERFGNNWPDWVDMTHSSREWQFCPTCDLKTAVEYHFHRLVGQFQSHAFKTFDGPPESAVQNRGRM